VLVACHRLGLKRARGAGGSAGWNAVDPPGITNRPSVHGGPGQNRRFDGVLAPELLGLEQAQPVAAEPSLPSGEVPDASDSNLLPSQLRSGPASNRRQLPQVLRPAHRVDALLSQPFAR